MDMEMLEKKMSVLKALGAPYDDKVIKNAKAMARAQAEQITKNMADAGVDMKMQDKQIIAMIAYLQRLGKTKKPVDAQILGEEKEKEEEKENEKKQGDRDAANVK
ncbi:MAG: cbb3-type cytochrome c oxidase subunit II, partial [Bacteriovoracaceae bacterium]